jgi:hypothetical protein
MQSPQIAAVPWHGAKSSGEARLCKAVPLRHSPTRFRSGPTGRRIRIVDRRRRRRGLQRRVRRTVDPAIGLAGDAAERCCAGSQPEAHSRLHHRLPCCTLESPSAPTSRLRAGRDRRRFAPGRRDRAHPSRRAPGRPTTRRLRAARRWRRTRAASAVRRQPGNRRGGAGRQRRQVVWRRSRGPAPWPICCNEIVVGVWRDDRVSPEAVRR